MVGTQVGNYRIDSKLSQGGMGTVYRGTHALLNKGVAIKVLNPELSHNKQMIERFFNEARATTAIKHPGIVEIIDFGYTTDFEAYIVMEFLQGEPLSRRVKRKRRFSEAEAAFLVRGMCSALAAAHALGIVHRDLKPDNIMLVPDEDMPLGVRPKLLDFGIAKLSGSDLADEYGMSKTRTGSVMGTPTYMSPEQCRGAGAVDHRADLYSLGCILYELVAARPPFVAEGAGELIGAHLYVDPDPPTKHGAQISPEFEALIMRLLAKRPDDRVASATDLMMMLTELAGAAARHDPMLLSPVSGVLAMATPGLGLGRGTAGSSPDLAPHLPKPTTLGGVASESVARLSTGGTPGWIKPVMIGVGLAAVGITGYLLVARSGDGGAPRTTVTPRPAAGSTISVQPLPTQSPAAPGPATASGSAVEPSAGSATAVEAGSATGTVAGTDAGSATGTATGTDAVAANGSATEATGPVRDGGKSGKPNKPDTRPDAKPDAKPDTKPDAKPDSKPDTKPDAKPDGKPDGKPDTSDGPIETSID